MRYLLILVFLYGTVNLFAQGGTSTEPYKWKKVVSREIDFGVDNSQQKDKTSRAKKDITLSQMMADAVSSGKVTGYSNLDMRLETKLDIYEQERITSRRKEKVEINDPVTGKADFNVIEKGVDYTNINKYRILEEWTFDPVNCYAQIQIIGIAPVKNIYGDDGIFRGVQGMFWLHYNDVKVIIDKYDLAHPQKRFSNAIWVDNFSKAVKHAGNYGQCFATRILNIDPVQDDVVRRHYKDQLPGLTVKDILDKEKYSQKVISWADFDKEFIIQLEQRGITNESLVNVDTVLVSDPVTGAKLMHIGKHINDSGEHRIKIIEQWSFESQSGKAQIKLIGIAPLVEVKNNNNSVKLIPLYWIRYSDIHGAIAQNDTYIPDNGLAINLWNNYFLSDTRPEMVK